MVACLRGQPHAAAAVDVTVVDAEAYIESVVAEPVADDVRINYERWNAGLALFGLAPLAETLAESTRDTWARVAGFYDTDTQSITILDRGYAAKSLSSVLLLAHESVHALQDVSGVFERERASSRAGLDGGLGASAMSEGEADLLEDLTFLRAGDWRVSHESWDNIFERWKAWAQLTSRNSLQPVSQARLLFPYAFGTEYVRDVWRAGGFAAVDALYDDVPQSTAEVIAGFGQGAPDGGWVDDLADQALPIAPTGYERSGWDRFGWWLLDAFCARESMDSSACPGSLRDDTFAVFNSPSDDAVAAVWRLRFESDAAATSFAGLVAGTIRAEQRGRDVILIRASPAHREADFISLAWTSVPVAPATAAPAPAENILCPHKQPGLAR